MTQSRLSQVSVDETPYYHCMTRCVRRAYLCGRDRVSGKNFDHRKPWVVERLRVLSSVFAIDVCAYAVMSNHLHVVLHVDRERAQGFGADEVVERYTKLFRMAKAQYDSASKREKDRLVTLWRERLWNLSWMMRGLSEWVARRANREDGCRGRFWEGRFKSQALLDTEGLLTCMAYVDLNPVRAGAADSLEGSDFTSIQARLEQAAKCKRHKQRQTGAKALLPFSDQVPVEQAAAVLGATDVSAETSSGANGVSSDRDTIPVTSRDVSAETSGGGMHADAGRDATGRRILPMTFSAYGELLEWVGRAMHAKANGRIRGCPPAILTDLGLDSEAFLTALTQQRLAHATALGTPERMEAQAQARGRAWLRGKQLAQDLTKPAR
ncbi:MAG: hypothetical protein OXR73_08855, partial [Myxococcales bacterium]|nr:hypothetical protein [Myxococcales bacterium]